MKINLGITQEEFFSKYLEKNFLLIKNAIDCQSFKWKDINNILDSTEASHNFIKIFQNGKIVPEEEYLKHNIEIGVRYPKFRKDKFYDLMENGSTLVINRVNAHNSFIQDLSSSFAKFVMSQTLANGYFAFGGDGSFGDHWDTHDVFAVQLFGKKRWKLYTPTFESPLTPHTSKNYKHERPKEAILDCILEPGDCLYIPKGWWHNALPTEKETFHIAIGVHVPPVIDYITWVARKILPDSLECRKSLRMTENVDEILLKAQDKIFDAISDKNNLRNFLEAVVKEERIKSKFSIDYFNPHIIEKNFNKKVTIPSIFLESALMRLKELNFDVIDYNKIVLMLKYIWDCAGATINDLIFKFPEVENNIDYIIEILVKQEILEFTDE